MRTGTTLPLISSTANGTGLSLFFNTTVGPVAEGRRRGGEAHAAVFFFFLHYFTGIRVKKKGERERENEGPT